MRKRLTYLSVISAVLIALLVACSPRPEENLRTPVSSLEHYVYAAAGEPLSGVTVEAYSAQDEWLASAVTDVNGAAKLEVAGPVARFGFDTPVEGWTLLCETVQNESVCQEVPLQDISAAVSLGELGLGAIQNATYLVVAEHSDKCLDVAGFSTDNGANVQQWACHGLDNQQWKIEALGGDNYRLIGAGSGKALDVSGISRGEGANVQQWAYGGGANQQWRAEASGDAYSFVAVHSGKCLDIFNIEPCQRCERCTAELRV